MSRQYFADIFKHMKENYCILLQINQILLLSVQLTFKSALVQLMAWRQSDDKPLTEPMIT